MRPAAKIPRGMSTVPVGFVSVPALVIPDLTVR